MTSLYRRCNVFDVILNDKGRYSVEQNAIVPHNSDWALLRHKALLLQSPNAVNPASTTTLNQRWFNINFQHCINVEIRLDLKVEWTLFQRCRRCFNVVSTLFQCHINVYPTFYQPCNKLIFWQIEYVFFINHTRNLFFFTLFKLLWHKINFLSLLLQFSLIYSLITNSMDSRIYQKAQQSTWLTILILIKLQNHILQFQDIFAFPPCSPSIQDGDYVTEHTETLISRTSWRSR